MNEIGTIIKHLRKNLTMTQNELCREICSQSVLSRIENNEEIPNVVVMFLLCRRLEVSMDWVMERNIELNRLEA
jgi:transcriptional regulator with XRE-family HTH domain